MSYDLDLFIPQPNLDPIQIIQQAALNNQPDAAHHTRNQALMQRMSAENPQFALHQAPHVLELTDPNDGLQISLYASTAHIALPYWHTVDSDIKLNFAVMRRFVRLIQTHIAYEVYDPQLGRVVNVERDVPQMVALYRQTLNRMQSFLGG